MTRGKGVEVRPGWRLLRSEVLRWIIQVMMGRMTRLWWNYMYGTVVCSEKHTSQYHATAHNNKFLLLSTEITVADLKRAWSALQLRNNLFLYKESLTLFYKSTKLSRLPIYQRPGLTMYFLKSQHRI